MVEFFHSSTEFFYLVLDPSGKLSYANPVFKNKYKEEYIFSTLAVLRQSLESCILRPEAKFAVRTGYQLQDNLVPGIRWEMNAVTGEDGKVEHVQAIGTIACTVAPTLEEMTETVKRLRYQAAILENVSDIIISCGADHLVKSWNKKAEEFYHITESEAIGKRITDLVQIDYSPSNREEAHTQLNETGSWRGEVKYHVPAGEIKWLLNHLSFLTNEEGDRVGVMVIGSDITERKKAEEDLRESEVFYRSLTSNSLDGILVTNAEGKLKFASPSVETILGFTPTEIIGRNAFEFVHPEDQDYAFNSFRNEVDESPVVRYIVIRLQKKNGSWVWCMVRGHNLLKTPRLGGLVIYFFDDTLRKSAEDALKESEERFRNLVRHLNMGVILRDADGKAILCNQYVLDFTGLSEKEFMETTTITDEVMFINEDDSELPPQSHPQVLAGRTKKPIRNVVLGAYRKRKKEWAWLILNAEPILDASGELIHVVTTFTDITERKKLEQQLLEEEVNKQRLVTRATIEGQEKERKEIGKELHDNIGQHLTTTKLYLDIAKGTADDATMELISLATKSVSDVINELRRLSRSITPPTLGDLGLIESIKDLCEPLKRTQAFAIRFYHGHFDEEHLQDDIKLMLFRIVQELINNIIRHSEATTILVRLQTDAEQLSLVIADNGKGFDTSIDKKGSGFTNIINRAGLFNGRMEIETGEEKGCRVRVTIPIGGL
jgi:PAS domain S-box-containing protein